MFSKKSYNFLGLVLLFIFTLIIIPMIFSSFNIFFLGLNNKHVSLLIIILTLLFNIALIFASIKINRYSQKLFIILLIIISSTLYLIWNIYASTVPVSDYRVLLEGAKKMLSGTFHEEIFNKTSYFYFYNYQIGYTTYLALIIKIFGTKIFWLKFFDCVYMVLTSLMVYKIVNNLSGIDSAAVAATLYSTFIPFITGSSIINNQHLSSFLLISSIYFILDKKILSSIPAGILIGFSQIFRPAAVILIIAVFLYYLGLSVKNSSFKHFALKFMLIFMFFTFITRGFDFLLIKNSLSPGPISKSNAKYFKFVLGLKGSGVYNIPTENARKTQVYYDLKTLNFDYDKYNDLCMETIKKMAADYKNTSKFIINKMYYFTGDRDNQYYFAISKNKLTWGLERILEIGHAQYILLLIFSLVAAIIKIQKKHDLVNLFSILIMGFIAVHIFIETQTRYRYEVYIFLIIFVSSLPLKFGLKKPLSADTSL